MTRNATNFINPITFESLTGNKCLVDTFDRNFQYSVEHVALAKLADVVMVAPASANVLAKAAHGLADDMLTTTLLACECPKLFAPAMNTRMYRNPHCTGQYKKHLTNYGHGSNHAGNRLSGMRRYGGRQDAGAGVFTGMYCQALQPDDMQGIKVLVTAGATREKLTP